jgi:hypothetical protein
LSKDQKTNSVRDEVSALKAQITGNEAELLELRSQIEHKNKKIQKKDELK